MAIANSYPTGTPKSGDLLLGTSSPTPGTNEKPSTRNFSVEAVASLVKRGYTEITKTLTNAEWLALPTTSVAVIPAQGSGSAVKILAAYLKFNYLTTSFFFNQGISIGSGNAGLNGPNTQCFLPNTFEDIDGYDVITLQTQNANINLNAPIYIGSPNAATNSGGGTVTVVLRYEVISTI